MKHVSAAMSGVGKGKLLNDIWSLLFQMSKRDTPKTRRPHTGRRVGWTVQPFPTGDGWASGSEGGEPRLGEGYVQTRKTDTALSKRNAQG